MVLKVGVLLLLLSLVVAASSFTLDDVSMEVMGGRVGDWIDTDEEAMMGSETARRVLAGQRQRYISYGALRANNVPCNKRGQSYYNCNQRGRANPYTRGCSYITHCGRYTRR
ncbi:Protein RALF-like [Actinidia chinensis var. chinensis]|uniref:Protein RALF-like n=1 Tax=Actinidia chinensis var. chinensis TaxID=1590841 RepID=A0A2R6QA67_ACTCC|nr:Protein RALF-like [Actinidia chinensis var. chinensis]